MRLTVEIKTTVKGVFYVVYDDRDTRNEGILGTGWAIRDAVDDFVQEFNRLSFYDDDTPVYITRDGIELKRVRHWTSRLF